MSRIRAAAFPLLVALAVSSCGYTLGPSAPLRGAQTVAIPVFENQTFRRGVEADVTKAVVSEVHARTPMRVVEHGADLVVRGTITKIEEDTVSLQGSQVIRESSLLVSGHVTVIDGRTGRRSSAAAPSRSGSRSCRPSGRASGAPGPRPFDASPRSSSTPSSHATSRASRETRFPPTLARR